MGSSPRSSRSSPSRRRISVSDERPVSEIVRSVSTATSGRFWAAYSAPSACTTMKATTLPMGPFELLDVVGNDVSLAIQETLVSTFGHAGWLPAPMLQNLVADGKLGRKTGAGFHTY